MSIVSHYAPVDTCNSVLYTEAIHFVTYVYVLPLHPGASPESLLRRRSHGSERAD